MAQFTPGPWHVTEDGFVVAEDGRRVGYMHGNPSNVFAEAARVSADRGLMASAPAMLAALEFYADVSKYPAPLTGGMGALWADCGEIARAAIAKAKGEA
jgi:hypothetical protein